MSGRELRVVQAWTGQDRQFPGAGSSLGLPPADIASGGDQGSPAHLGDDVLFARPMFGMLPSIAKRGRVGRGVGPNVLIAIGLAWFPLLVLTVVQGGITAFAVDIGVHARFLIALPLLVTADAVTAPRLDAVARHFLDAGFVRDDDRARYAAIVAATKASLGSRLSAIAIGLVAYAAIFAVLLSIPLDRLPGWHVSGAAYSVAGWWHALVSLPLLLAVLFGWIWRIFLWARFLRRMSRLDLELVAAHPDKAAGLAFVGHSLRACAVLALAIATIMAGSAANHALHDDSPIFAPVVLGATSLLVSLLLFGSPLLAFWGVLSREWRRGVFAYGELASRFGQGFERKWLDRGQFEREDDLASPDFSAATDLYQVASNVYAMRFVPLDLASLILLAGAALVPFAPVLLLNVPFAEIMNAVKSLLF